jgi:hypothetical protein
MACEAAGLTQEAAGQAAADLDDEAGRSPRFLGWLPLD